MLRAALELVREMHARGDTALNYACRNGDTPVIAALIDSGADVNALSDSRHFPLYCAAGHCHARATAILLRHGADWS